MTIVPNRTPLHCGSKDRVVTSKLVDVSVVMNKNLKLDISWAERFCLTQQLHKLFSSRLSAIPHFRNSKENGYKL